MNLAIAFLVAFIAGGINSVAGGGSMVSFPVLIMLGVPPLLANATNTVGIWPGAIGSLWGFRPEIKRVPAVYRWLLFPSIVGSVAGALLLKVTPASVFDRIVPGLVFLATFLFLIAPLVRQKLKASDLAASQLSVGRVVLVACLQAAVGVYGGYFGAGMSIAMLSLLALLGMTDMLEMSAMTSLLSLSINGVAGVIFGISGLVLWPYALVMAVSSVLGGYGAAGIARKIGGVWIRRLVILVGISLAVILAIRAF